MGSDSSKPEAKEASSNKRNSCSMLEKLVAMNAMKTELRQYNLAIIITMDTICSSSAGRANFEAVNYQAFACDRQEGRFGKSAGQTTSKSYNYTACLCRLIIIMHKSCNIG